MVDLANRARETNSTTGTGSFVVTGAVSGHQTFENAGIGNSVTISYMAEIGDGTEWEVGRGVYTTADNTLTRATILGSSNAGSVVNFSSAPEVAIVALAEDLVPVDDTQPLVRDPADNTKTMRIDVGAVATATERTLTMPNANVDLGDMATQSGNLDQFDNGADGDDQVHTSGRDLLINNKRAMVGYATADGDVLEIDFSGDFANGVRIGGTSNFRLPDGTTAQRPGSPANGMMRYNTSLNELEARINGAWENLLGGGGSIVGIQTRTTTGTYTPNANASFALIILTGGGAGGGGGPTNAHGGGGGGAGETVFYLYDTSSGNQTVTIGSGGSGGAATASGSNGGDSTFGSLCGADGGLGGELGGGTRGGEGGDGGTGGTAGDLNIEGGDGDSGSTEDGSSEGAGGAGGASFWGGGGTGSPSNDTNATNRDGRAYGSGGGGGGTNDAGRDGRAGVFMALEFA